MYVVKETYKIYENITGNCGFKGFSIISKNKKIVIKGQKITNIMIINKKLATPLVKQVIINRYQKLITILSELLITDDETGTNLVEALNRIEKFRLEIKNKYRIYLKQKELDYMAKQLKNCQKEANRRYIEILNNRLYFNKDIGRKGR